MWFPMSSLSKLVAGSPTWLEISWFHGCNMTVTTLRIWGSTRPGHQGPHHLLIQFRSSKATLKSTVEGAVHNSSCDATAVHSTVNVAVNGKVKNQWMENSRSFVNEIQMLDPKRQPLEWNFMEHVCIQVVEHISWDHWIFMEIFIQINWYVCIPFYVGTIETVSVIDHHRLGKGPAVKGQLLPGAPLRSLKPAELQHASTETVVGCPCPCQLDSKDMGISCNHGHHGSLPIISAWP